MSRLRPHTSVDPTGLYILARVGHDLGPVFTEWGVSRDEFTSAPFGSMWCKWWLKPATDSNLLERASKWGSVSSEIAHGLLLTRREFRVVTGSTGDESRNILDRHIRERLAITIVASAGRGRLGRNQPQTANWNAGLILPTGADAIAALRSLETNPSQCTMGCWNIGLLAQIVGIVHANTNDNAFLQNFAAHLGNDPLNRAKAFGFGPLAENPNIQIRLDPRESW